MFLTGRYSAEYDSQYGSAYVNKYVDQVMSQIEPFAWDDEESEKLLKEFGLKVEKRDEQLL